MAIRISDLVTRLQRIQRDHGDLRVVAWDDNGPEWFPEDGLDVYSRETHFLPAVLVRSLPELLPGEFVVEL